MSIFRILYMNKSVNGKKIIAAAVKVILFIAIFAALFAGVYGLTRRKESEKRNKNFFAVADKIDVLFLGSSHVINGVNPLQLFEDYGIASYNLGGHGNVMPVTYWEFANALDYCQPKFVLIDTYLLDKDYHYLDVQTGQEPQELLDTAVGQLHEVLDVFPLTKTKIAALNDLLSTGKARLEFIFSFIRYHSRWSQLTADDFSAFTGDLPLNRQMGAEMLFEVDPGIDHYEMISDTRMDDRQSQGREYLRKIIELCMARGIHPIIIQVPFSANEETQLIANSAKLIADEYEIPFLNMQYLPGLIDYHSDQASQTHLNMRGAYKTTEFLGESLSVLELPDRRGDPEYALWEEEVREWHDTIREKAANPKDLYAALATLQYDDVSSIVFINSNSNAFYDPALMDMIKTLVGTNGIEAVSEEHRSYCMIHDSKNDVYLETGGSFPMEDITTSFGVVNFFSPVPEWNMLTLGDDTETNLLDYYNTSDIDVQIFVFDNRNSELMAHLCFDDAGMETVAR